MRKLAANERKESGFFRCLGDRYRPLLATLVTSLEEGESTKLENISTVKNCPISTPFMVVIMLMVIIMVKSQSVS